MSLPVSASRLLTSLLMGISLLSACGKQDSAGLVTEAKARLAAGDTQAAIIQLKNAVAEDGKNAEARFELGKLYLEQGNMAGAEKEFRRAREAGYPARTVNPLIARTLLGQREFQRVLDEVPAPAEQDADAAVLLSLRATAELALGQKESARKTIERALEMAPQAAEVHLARVHLALADNDAVKAMQALDEALRLDPRHRDALLLKGDLLRATGKPVEAAAAYRQLLRVDARHIAARVALAELALADNKPAEARKEIDAALKVMPNSLLARYTQALIDFREKKTGQARDHLAAVLQSAPGYGPALLLGGSIEYALGNLQTAETHLNKVVKAAPTNLYALRLLSATQLSLGRLDEAERTLAPALQVKSPDAGALVVAGEIALARNDFSRASSYFEQAAQQNPDNSAIRTELGISRLAQGDSRAMADLQTAADMEGATSRADNFIILNQLKKKEFDAALVSIAVLEKKASASPLTWNYKGAAYLGKKDNKRARDSFVQALKLDPGFYPAAANLAQLDLKEGQPRAARQRFESILKADPRHLNSMLALADLALLAKDERKYVDWLEKAASAHPQALDPRVTLARYRLSKGEKNKALAIAREAVNAQPKNPAALDLLGSTQLASGDLTNALASYRKLVELTPGQARPLTQLAAIQIMTKDAPAARKTLQNALRIEPNFAEAQLILGSIEIQSGHFEEALRLARQIQQHQPDSAAGFMMEGDAAFARKDYPAAIASFERAQKRQPSGTILLRQLSAFKASQRPEEGEKRLYAWLAAHPQDVGIRAALAENLIQRQQYKAASEHYLFINRSTPNNLLILNNLAWSLHESRDSRALGFAEQALKLKPDNPAVLDTLGWILVGQGQVERGTKLLQQALAKSPDTAEIQYHLAVALNRSGDSVRAKREIERLLASGVAFPQEPEARALLKQLESGKR